MVASTHNPARESLRKEQAEQRKAAKHTDQDTDRDTELTKALKDTFPASDPVAVQSATKAVKKKRPAH